MSVKVPAGVVPESGLLADPRPVFVRGAFNYDRDYVSRFTAVRDFGPSLTVQSEKEESDINTIVKRFGVTGELPSGVRVPQFGDFTEIFDFQSAQNTIVAARNSFMELPAAVRKRFNNDPQEFMEFCAKEENLPEMRKMGLAVPEKEPEPEPEPLAVRVVSDDVLSDNSPKPSGSAKEKKSVDGK